MSTEKKIATCDWFRKANFYQIYSRVHKCRDKNGDGQITAGEFSTFVDIRADLERIKDLNINAIWLMPIHPIGKINRKGQYGSPYAVRDYLGIDINFIERPRGGNYTDDELRRLGKQQLKDLIATTHEMGMRIILSFVGSHCAPDNLLLDPRNTTEKGGYHPDGFSWMRQAFLHLPVPTGQIRRTSNMVRALMRWINPNTRTMWIGKRCGIS